MEEMEFSTNPYLNPLAPMVYNSTKVGQFEPNLFHSNDQSKKNTKSNPELNKIKQQIDENSELDICSTIGIELVKKEFHFRNETIVNQNSIIAKIPKILTLSEALDIQKEFLIKQKNIEKKYRQKLDEELDSELAKE